MRILQIAPPWIATPPKGYGGTELVVYNLCKGFVELGHNVTLFATKDSVSPDELDYVFPKGFVDMDIDWSASLPPLIHYHQAFKRAHEFDIVHAHLSSGTDLMILPFMSDLIKQGMPCIMTIHGHWPYDRSTYMDPYFKKLYAENIPAISISKTMKKLLPKEFRDAGYVHNSLDPNTLKFHRKGSYLTWLGKIVPDKGTHEAILAAKAVGWFAGLFNTHPPVEERIRALQQMV